jgi:hypothetical protein
MPQYVPAWQFDENALKVRQFLYAYCCTNGVAPHLGDVNAGTGLSREAITEAYRKLDLGGMIVVDHETQNLNLLKVLPFASFPSAVKLIVDGKFHSYLGCAMESVATSKMPPFAGKDLRLDSYCACCLAPISVAAKDGVILSATPDSTLIHVSLSPWDWNAVDFIPMCDSMNYVLDADHALAYEKRMARRGVLFNFDQAMRFVAGVANNRMWDYHWSAGGMNPAGVLEAIRGLGVDTSNWG